MTSCMMQRLYFEMLCCSILNRAVTINRFIGILQYQSEKVQYIGTKRVLQYIVVTINRTKIKNI